MSEARAGHGSPAPRNPFKAEIGSTRPFIRVERRSLLSLLAAGVLPRVDAAAITYPPKRLLDDLGVLPEEAVERFFEGLPIVSGVYATCVGRLAGIMLPCFDFQFYQDSTDLRRHVHEAIAVARSVGARAVSLVGLLASTTDQGRAVVAACAEADGPRLSTGTATVAAAVRMSIESMLRETGRDLTRERVGFLGLGGIGSLSLQILLQTLPHPRELILCDVYDNAEKLERLCDAIRRELGFTGRVRVLHSKMDAPAEFYDASFIIGATNVTTALDIGQLRPGTVIVDDSYPHCFDTAAAVRRVEEQGDILLGEAGYLRLPQPIHRLRYVPRVLEQIVDLEQINRLEPPDPRVIGSCVFSGLLSAYDAGAPPTIGPADASVSLKHYEALRRMGCETPPPLCDDYLLPREVIAAFRSRYGLESS